MKKLKQRIWEWLFCRMLKTWINNNQFGIKDVYEVKMLNHCYIFGVSTTHGSHEVSIRFEIDKK